LVDRVWVLLCSRDSIQVITGVLGDVPL
jgi:hypothetical protein